MRTVAAVFIAMEERKNIVYIQSQSLCDSNIMHVVLHNRM